MGFVYQKTHAKAREKDPKILIDQLEDSVILNYRPVPMKDMLLLPTYVTFGHRSLVSVKHVEITVIIFFCELTTECPVPNFSLSSFLCPAHH